MNKAKFWAIIQESIKKHPGTSSDAVYRREKFLVDRLQLETLEDLHVFEKIWRAYEGLLDRDDIYKVACKVDSFGELSDDSWHDARQFMICQGKANVDLILANPRTLRFVAGVEEGQSTNIVTEVYVCMKALDKKTGEEFRDTRNDLYHGRNYNLAEDCLA